MEKIKIITDSTADLPSYIVNKYDIEVLPLLVSFGEETYTDGVDLQVHQLFMKVKEKDTFPTTSQVIPQRFYECFKKYLEDGYKIVCINLSSKMSGTYQSACIAKDMLETEDIIVIDSLNVTSGLGLLVLKACKLKEQGLGLKEIEKEIVRAIPHVKSCIAFNALDHLVKGGRLSKTAGVIGGLLGIKPILAVKDGEMTVIDKVRGSKKAIKYILDYTQKVEIKKDELSILLQAGTNDIVDLLRVSLLGKNIDFVQSEVGCVVGVHSGPGACGIFYFENY